MTHPLRSVWHGILARCTNPNSAAWMHYGGRGIRVCDRWRESFESFVADVGPRPEGTSIDRIDPDGDYEPANVRWATAREQALNKRATVRDSAGVAVTADEPNAASYSARRKRKRPIVTFSLTTEALAALESIAAADGVKRGDVLTRLALSERERRKL